MQRTSMICMCMLCSVVWSVSQDPSALGTGGIRKRGYNRTISPSIAVLAELAQRGS